MVAPAATYVAPFRSRCGSADIFFLKSRLAIPMQQEMSPTDTKISGNRMHLSSCCLVMPVPSASDCRNMW